MASAWEALSNCTGQTVNSDLAYWEKHRNCEWQTKHKISTLHTKAGTGQITNMVSTVAPHLTSFL